MSRAAVAAVAKPVTQGSPADSALSALLAKGLLGGSEAEFLRLGTQFRDQLAPRNLLEALQIDLALMALALLRRALAALADAPGDARALREHARAHRMLTGSLKEFGLLRKRDLTTAATNAAAPVIAPAASPPPATVSPTPTPTPTPPTPPPHAARPADSRLAGLVPPILDLFATRRQQPIGGPAPAAPLVSDGRRR